MSHLDLFTGIKSIGPVVMRQIYGLISSCVSDSKRDDVEVARHSLSEGLHASGMWAGEMNLGSVCGLSSEICIFMVTEK